ncbi:helix-turn-helix domain-containing protein [Streptomyces umbrinus]|uniref:helix-turn-helix domain-containing protein n=1 Tax=Streptomyces umbrinus TaxID=67370 RepID=UPI0033F42C85
MGEDSGSPSACHNVARHAEIWHENDSGLGRESRGVRIEFAKLTREIKWKRGALNGNEGRYRIPLWILEAVAEHQPVTAGGLANRFGLPKPTAQRTLVTLGEAG